MKTIAFLGLLMMAWCARARAQFTMNWHTIDGGRGASTSGSFSLNGTIGQPDAGAPMSSGGFTISGAIKPGDLLTTSDTPGRAMKVTNSARAQGAILGKAMSALKEGKGLVLVLVTLQ